MGPNYVGTGLKGVPEAFPDSESSVHQVGLQTSNLGFVLVRSA